VDTAVSDPDSSVVSSPLRVLVVEDQTMVLVALAALLDLEPDIRVVGQLRSGNAARDWLAGASADIVVTDIEMPDGDGFALSEWLREQGRSERVIVLTTFARPGYLQRALRAGALGYLLKDGQPDDLLAAIRGVAQGRRVIAPGLAAEALLETNPLTARERDVLALAGEGHSSKLIARRLHLSQGTVRNYLSEAISKLGAANRIDAARRARDRGWLDPIGP
jgi:two-component system response regulator DesR